MTLTQLIAAVKAFGYGSENDAVITTFLNMAYMDVASRRRWRWTESLTTINTVANNETTLLSGYLFFGDMFSLTPNVANPEFVDNKSEIDDLHRNLTGVATVRGVPEKYTIVGAFIYWFPVPNAVYSYRLYTWMSPFELSLPGDQPAFNSAFHQVLVEGALMHLASRDHNPSRVQEHKARFDELISNMEMKDRFRNSSSSHLFLPKSYGGMYDN